jgi:hypothetical protein
MRRQIIAKLPNIRLCVKLLTCARVVESGPSKGGTDGQTEQRYNSDNVRTFTNFPCKRVNTLVPLSEATFSITKPNASGCLGENAIICSDSYEINFMGKLQTNLILK